MRPGLAAAVLLTVLGVAAGQDAPFVVPQPLGGPIVGPDGRIRTGLDAHPVASPWSSAVDLGLSGSLGNTDTLKLWSGLDVQYNDPDDYAILNVLYILNRDNTGEIEHKGFAILRNELPMDMGIAWYAQGLLEYDRFRAVDLRIGSHSGLSYTAIEDGTQLLKVRAGAGRSWQWGDRVSEWVTEGQAGLTYYYKLTANTRLTAMADYYPDLNDFSSFRVRVWATFDVLLDPEANIFLRFGAFNRYDRTPYAGERNALDYYMTFHFRF